MSRRREYRLDALVKTALRAGPMRPAPFGLHGRIWRRLEIAAMIERERRRFRIAVGRAILVVCVISGAAAGALWLWNPLHGALNAVPGMMGLFDYVMAYSQTASRDLVGAGMTVLWTALAVVFLLFLLLVAARRKRVS
jgi:ABC-type sugar transport system permease subunit